MGVANADFSSSSIFPAAKYITRLCHQQWGSDEILPRITDIPILFLSGLKDEIIPYVLYPSFTHPNILDKTDFFFIQPPAHVPAILFVQIQDENLANPPERPT